MMRMKMEIQMIITLCIYIILVPVTGNQCDISKFININHHGKIDVVFNLSRATEGELIYIHAPTGNVLYSGPLGELSKHSHLMKGVSSRLKTLVNDKSMLKVEIRDVQKEDAGKYCCEEGSTIIPGCSLVLQVVAAPVLVKYNSGFDKSMATVGKNISLSKMIMAYPKPKLHPVIIPSGVDLDRVNVYLRNDTSKPHHYIVMMEVLVMSKDYLGRYCVYVINSEGELQVCFLLLADPNEARETSEDWTVFLLVAMVAVAMLIVITVVVFRVWRRYRRNNYDHLHLYSRVV